MVVALVRLPAPRTCWSRPFRATGTGRAVIPYLWHHHWVTTDRIDVQRTVKADPAAIFAVLCDPQGHVAIDGSGMLMDAEGPW